MSMQQEQSDDLGFCPSFSCYSSNSPASTAASKVSIQLQQQQEEFEFSFKLGDEEPSVEDTASDARKDFPLFNRDLLIQNDVNNEQNDCTDSLEKLFITEREESACSSSDSSDGESPGMFCVWRYKNDEGSSPLSRCKKSSSTGSGSKRWRIRDLLRRSNSEGKEPMALLTRKKVEVSKQGRSSGEASVVVRQAKPSSVHELLYVQQRAKREGGKRRSYLPYRQGLVGFFTNVNGSGKKF